MMEGSIPVGTGNPNPLWGWSGGKEVYPRGHGESLLPLEEAERVRGLSPWARGIPYPSETRILPRRSIPVGTGNPGTCPLIRSPRTVYPRGHGESIRDYLPVNLNHGLSPWARGIPSNFRMLYR